MKSVEIGLIIVDPPGREMAAALLLADRPGQPVQFRRDLRVLLVARLTECGADLRVGGAFDRAGPVYFAAFGIGAYNPWEHMHATPEQVWTMFRNLRGERLLPIHHSTFELSDEHVDEPLERLIAAAGEFQPRIITLDPGALWIDGDAPPDDRASEA